MTTNKQALSVEEMRDALKAKFPSMFQWAEGSLHYVSMLELGEGDTAEEAIRDAYHIYCAAPEPSDAEIRSMTIEQFANMVCRDLPEGWYLNLAMENGAGYFELITPNGEYVNSEDYCSVDYKIAEQGKLAIDYAIRTEAAYKRGNGE